MTRFLASVADLAEMEIARAAGADIVDLKDPRAGALGAWDRAMLREAVALWSSWGDPKPLLSATIGDHPFDAATIEAAVSRIASTGVPIVKLGIFPGPDPLAAIEALRGIAAGTSLVALFLADRAPDFSLLPHLAEGGFYGAMVDTADKQGGGLRRHLDDAALKAFIARSRELGLATGLAGSLATTDIAPLAALGPDYLGFRGALCRDGRTGALDVEAAAAVRRMIDAASAAEDEHLALPLGV